MQNKLNGIATLTHLGVISAQGVDAAKFLHGQLSQDFLTLGMSKARLAAYCSAKGRMLASFIGIERSPTEILLICNLDILSNTLKRLSMFILRAKVKLSDVSGDYALLGLAGDSVEAVATGTHPVWAKTDVGAASVITLYPADGVPRALWLAPVNQSAPVGQAISESNWVWGEVRSGIAMISTPIVEALVPQMLNYESIGGVNFKKGCYPGQEVVARSQFRGTLKRRAYLAHCDAPMRVGDEVFQAGDDGQPCGIVAQAAASPAASPAGFDAVVSLQISAKEAGNLHVGNAHGPALQVAMPPYPLLADI
jgi:folate-binding protein YgfZ